MKKTPRISKYIIPLLLLSTCFSIGFSSWKIYSENNYIDTEIGTKGDDAVAYIKDGNNKTYYTSLEKAIDVANSYDSNTDVWVIPGTVYTLESNKLKTITIKSNVTLQLPYYKEKVFDVWKTGTTQNSNGKDISDGIWDPDDDKKQDEWPSSVCALDNPSEYLKTQIILGSNVELVNNGTINIGGIIGGMGGGTSGTPCGQTCHYYSEILCDGLTKDLNPQITNNGTIKNQGSIASTNYDYVALENKTGSTINTVLILGENRGGSALVDLGGGFTKALANNLKFDVSPFNTIYAANITAKMKTNNGSFIYGLAAMYGNSSHNQVKINIYGNNGSFLFQSSEGYLITRSFKNKYKKDSVSLDFYGSHNINYMEMSITAPIINKKVDIRTNTVLFPLSYVNKVGFNSLNGKASTISSTQDIKVLPGGKLTIGENVTFNVGKLAIYDSSFVDPLTDGVTYPTLKEDGLFELSGSAKINEFGGYVTLKKESALLNVIASTTIKSNQIIGNPANVQNEEFVFNASSMVSTNGGIDLYLGNLTSPKEYTSLKNDSSSYYFSVDEIKHTVKIKCCGKFSKPNKIFGIVASYKYVYPTFDFIGPDGNKISSMSQSSDTYDNEKNAMIPYDYSLIVSHGSTVKISNLKNGSITPSSIVANNFFVVNNDINITISYK